MRLKNTSRYPSETVRALIDFAMRGIDPATLAVHVKNSRIAYRGRAYNGIPACSPAARQEGVARLVTIGIGAAEKFPCDNMTARVRWRAVRPGQPYDPR